MAKQAHQQAPLPVDATDVATKLYSETGLPLVSSVNDVNGGDYTILESEHYVLGEDSGASGNSMVLPAAPANGKVIQAVNVNASNLLTLDAGAGDTIQGIAAYEIPADRSIGLVYEAATNLWRAMSKLSVCGSLYVQGGAAEQTLNGTGGLWDKVTGFATAGVSLNTTVSTASDEITVALTGDYQANLWCSAESNTNNWRARLTLFKNPTGTTDLGGAGGGTRISSVSCQRELGTGSDTGDMNCGDIISLAAGDVIVAAASSISTVSASFIPVDMTMALVLV